MIRKFAIAQNNKKTRNIQKKLPLFSLIISLVTFPLYADWDPANCRAKRTQSNRSSCASVVMTVIGPEIALIKYDFLGAALAYTTQYGLGKTRTPLKNLIDSPRPCGCPGSFPSGHMIKYAAASSFLHYRYGWQYGLPAHILAFAFSHDRIRMEAHSWRDLIGTFALINLAQYILIPRFDKDVRYLPEFLTGSDEPKVVKGQNTMQFRPLLAAIPEGGLALGFSIKM